MDSSIKINNKLKILKSIFAMIHFTRKIFFPFPMDCAIGKFFYFEIIIFIPYFLTNLSIGKIFFFKSSKDPFPF